MKILHANNYGQGFGTEKYIKEIMDGMIQRDHQCELFVQEVCGGNHPIKALGSARRNLDRLRSMIQQMNPDIIHVHNITNYKLLDELLQFPATLKSIHEFRPFCIPRRIRPDTEQHCDITLSGECFKRGCYHYSPGDIYRFIMEKFGGKRLVRFQHIWVYSHFMKRFAQPLVPDSCDLQTVNYFYDPPADPPPDPPEEYRIFSAGRLVKDKGYHKFFEALAQLDLPVHVKLAGEGDQEESLRKQALDSNLNVDFLGYHSPAELEQYYRWCKVAVFPSDYPEPFGIVGLEAMGAARPVVAFDVGGVTDWLQDSVNGFVVPRDDISGYANRLKQLLTDTDSATKMGREGRRIVLEQFSSANHMDLLEKTYRKIADTVQ